jgi:penicillin V acylase-like amidase (Ntn superfamily)
MKKLLEKYLPGYKEAELNEASIPRFDKRHLEFLVDVLVTMLAPLKISNTTKHELIEIFASHMARTNQNFDTQRFVRVVYAKLLAEKPEQEELFPEE